MVKTATAQKATTQYTTLLDGVQTRVFRCLNQGSGIQDRILKEQGCKPPYHKRLMRDWILSETLTHLSENSDKRQVYNYERKKRTRIIKRDFGRFS